MTNPMGFPEQRQELRVRSELPALISIGSQLTLQGQLKDLSLKSAFICIRSSVFWKINDEIGVAIQYIPKDNTTIIEGMARISRIVPGEGLAVYFTRMDDRSLGRLKDFLQKVGGR